jgi:DNA replication licensing factor MCM4
MQDIETLSAYITYGRTKIHPIITDEASQELISCYVELRKLGESPGSNDRRVTATTRQLESLIRLSEAHARMRFSSEVQLSDVQEANRLMRDAIRTSATDPTTGLIDLDYVNIGAGLQQRKMRGDLKKELLDMIERGGNAGVRWADALKGINAQSTVTIDSNEFTEVVRALEAEGVVKVVGDHQRRVIRKIQTE